LLRQILISILIGYGLGSIQSAYLLGRLVRNIDIREHGTGNAGASNVTSTLGLKYGAVVAVLDILKGTLAVLVVRLTFPGTLELAYLAGLTAVVGHMFPFYLRFRGGKGVAALVGMMFGMDWRLGILFVLLVVVPALASDYIVVGSMTAFSALPVLAYLQGQPPSLVGAAALLTGVSWYLHRENIQRVLGGMELKISSVLFKR
jgi:glycerol-3-phosphate acyltransferase PlsY